ncbi:VOC family protein [Agrobacterium tumefaciens]|uniref:VOC family protein n=1 Tax=Agrobacterium tumefaciens TaxID=358 RepID=UPI001BB6E971|nr:VOC family protein [Agrobacterium tumefaciens]QTK83037.1 VOC family protein [Agrobacterium tumefaciens]
MIYSRQVLAQSGHLPWAKWLWILNLAAYNPMPLIQQSLRYGREVIQIERGAKMSADFIVELSLFVEHGREREAANFYAAAFGAQEENTNDIDGALAAVEMRFGNLPVWVAGSNPNREKSPSYGGPFFPKEPGAVSTIFQLKVGNIEGVMQRALSAGAVIRDEIQTDVMGRRVASIFDPFGHIWALVERKAESMSLAA